MYVNMNTLLDKDSSSIIRLFSLFDVKIATVYKGGG